MNDELKELVAAVKGAADVRVAVEQYFESIVFSMLKDEWMRMTEDQKQALVNKLSKGK